jgi:hypothetical protein
MSWIPAFAGMTLLCNVFVTPACAAQFSFAAFGDTPYNGAEALLIPGMMAEMDREELVLALHVGDFKNPGSACSDALYLKRREWFAAARHPFVFIPGDNDWLDCGRSRSAPHDPLERLAKLRELFFPGESTLGKTRLAVERQAKRGYPEHLRWVVEGIVFATLNVPGPSNNAGGAESPRRTAAVIDWMRETFFVARERRLAGIVLALHADLWIGHEAYRPIVDALAEEALRYGSEVLVVHGDTHMYRFDQPLVDPHSGRKVANVKRLVVFGSPFVNWTLVNVSVDGGKARFNAVTGGR